MKVKELPTRSILWHKNTVLGVVGVTLPNIFDECECHGMSGLADNPFKHYFDYYLSPQDYTEEQKKFIDQMIAENEEENE